MKDIKIEEARDQKIEDLPLFETYYLGLARRKGIDWICCLMNVNKDNVLSQLRLNWQGYDEYKIVSIKLPF